MDFDEQLKLQAFFDGELPEKEAREMAALLARDADAAALHGELRNTRQALKNFEPELKLPESREFYWSKIEREIERLQLVEAPVEAVSLFKRLRRIFIPVGAMAALVLAGVLAVHQFSGGAHPIAVNAILADAGAFTYRDQAEGMTVVWLSYPAENKLANAASGDTLPAK
jgi:anti-sigma factor RsiW